MPRSTGWARLARRVSRKTCRTSNRAVWSPMVLAPRRGRCCTCGAGSHPGRSSGRESGSPQPTPRFPGCWGRLFGPAQSISEYGRSVRCQRSSTASRGRRCGSWMRSSVLGGEGAPLTPAAVAARGTFLNTGPRGRGLHRALDLANSGLASRGRSPEREWFTRRVSGIYPRHERRV